MKPLHIILAVVAVIGAAYWWLVIRRRPANYASLTPAQQAAYNKALLNAANIDSSVYE